MTTPRRTRLYALSSATGQSFGMALDAVTDALAAVDVLVSTTAATGIGAMPREWRAAAELCRHPMWLVELAARLGLPLVHAAVMVKDMERHQLIALRFPDQKGPDVHTLRRVITGLQRLKDSA